MLKKRIINYLPYILFFITSVFLIVDAGIYRHWTSVTDMDLMLIYNSLILRSDMYNDLVDHPGYSTILLISLWWDFLNLLGVSNIGNLYEIEKSEDLKGQFQNLFVYSRIINIFLIFFLTTVIFKIINYISNNRVGSCILALAFSLSFTTIEVAGQLRTELLSCVCLFSFFYFLLKFSEDTSKFRSYLFFSGIVFILGMLSKMQFLFVIVFFPFMLFYFFKTQNNKSLFFFFFENKNFFLILNIIFFIIIGLIWHRYSEGVLNKLFIPAIVIYFCSICLIFKFYFQIKLSSLNAYLVYFFGGQGMAMIFFYLYKKFSLWNLIVLVNMPGWITRYAEKKEAINAFDPSFSAYLDLLNNHLGKLFDFISIYFLNPLTFEFFVLFIYFVSLIALFFKNKLKINSLLKFFSYLLIFLFVSFIFSFRPNPFYLIFITPLLLFGLTQSINSFSFFKIKKNFILFSFLILFSSLLNFSDRKSYPHDSWDFACSNPDGMSTVWLIKMKPETYRKICDFGIY